MKKKILIDIPYNHHIEVTPALYLQLVECNIYSHDGWGESRKFSLTDEVVSLELVNLPDSLEEVNIQDIAAENNRLNRLVEKLEAEIVKLTSSQNKELSL